MLQHKITNSLDLKMLRRLKIEGDTKAAAGIVIMCICRHAQVQLADALENVAEFRSDSVGIFITSGPLLLRVD